MTAMFGFLLVFLCRCWCAACEVRGFKALRIVRSGDHGQSVPPNWMGTGLWSKDAMLTSARARIGQIN
jgi:hypothetical protein